MHAQGPLGSQTPSRASMLLMEAQKLAALTTAQTVRTFLFVFWLCLFGSRSSGLSMQPLLGGESVNLAGSDFSGITPQRYVSFFFAVFVYLAQLIRVLRRLMTPGASLGFVFCRETARAYLIAPNVCLAFDRSNQAAPMSRQRLAQRCALIDLSFLEVSSASSNSGLTLVPFAAGGVVDADA